MGESRPPFRLIALIVALMLSSGVLGWHLAERTADHTPDPYPHTVFVPR